MMELRTITNADEQGIRSLFAACFGKELSREEWVWKYRHSPWGSEAAIALDGEDIVAHYGGVGARFYAKGRILTVFQPCDVMTHPKYRARIFSKKGAMVKAGELFYASNPMDFAFGFPSERHAILGTKQLGYTPHSYVTVLSKKASMYRPFGGLFVRVERGWDALNESELDTLWKKAREEYSLTLDKDYGYLCWRYRDHPSGQYEPLLVRSRYGKTLQAFAVYAVRESELHVLDFFSVRSFNIKILLRLFENTAVRNGLGVVRVWVHPNESVFRTFERYGYAAEKGVPYIFKILNDQITPSFLFDAYCYRMGDYDAA
jgi:hypothetical protein